MIFLYNEKNRGGGPWKKRDVEFWCEQGGRGKRSAFFFGVKAVAGEIFKKKRS